MSRIGGFWANSCFINYPLFPLQREKGINYRYELEKWAKIVKKDFVKKI